MASLTLTPHSSKESDVLTWEHIEEAAAALNRQTTLDLLSETFARLTLKANLENELRPPSTEDEPEAEASLAYSNDDDNQDKALLRAGFTAPIIKVTPPSPPDVGQVKCTVVVPVSEAETAGETEPAAETMTGESS